MDNRQRILDRFGRQAERFEDPRLSLARREHLRWAVSFLDLHPAAVALDVAGGTGLLGRAVAPRVSAVTVLDLTPAMLAQGRIAADNEGVRNIRFLRGEAEHLPFPDAAFDVAMTRFSLHHIPDPGKVVREMARVTRPAGQVAVIDLIAPDDPELARRYNHFERLRDSSHARALSRAELEALVARACPRLLRSGSLEIEADLEDWLAMAHAPADSADEIRRALQAELGGGAPTGMRPLQRERLMFTQTAVALVAAHA